MPERRPIDPVLGSAIPALLDHDWEAVHNSTRWTESIPVEEVRSFVDQLPGVPISPTADEVINDHVVMTDDGSRMQVLMPIRLSGSDQIWAMRFIFTTFGEEDGGKPDWLWGLDHQQLITNEELSALKQRAPSSA